MFSNLIEAGYFREITTQGRKVWVLKSPIQVVVTASVLAELKRAYPKSEETGGILWAYPNGAGALIITRWNQLVNTLPANQRKTAYRPASSAAIVNAALNAGALPIRFHSHPVNILESLYDRQPLNFFQKTSTTDRHNSYLPLNLNGYTVVLPDGLLSPADRAGNDVRFYLYGGFVAPDSLRALLTSEKVYIYFAVALILVAYLFGGLKRTLPVLLLAALLSVIVFIAEKRPTGVLNADKDLVISIP